MSGCVLRGTHQQNHFFQLVEDSALPKIPECPEELPAEFRQRMRDLSDGWMRSGLRPVVESGVARAWDQLIRDWVNEPTMPLYIRKNQNNRGSLIKHESGRMLIPTDNSVAQWSAKLAYGGTTPKLQDIEAWWKSDKIPIAHALKSAERKQAKYQCTIGRALKPSLNGCGWKICHIEPVKIRPQRTQLCEILIDHFEAHFVRLLSPSNMFLVPKTWAGLGELPEMLEAARRFALEGE